VAFVICSEFSLASGGEIIVSSTRGSLICGCFVSFAFPFVRAIMSKGRLHTFFCFCIIPASHFRALYLTRRCGRLWLAVPAFIFLLGCMRRGWSDDLAVVD
jgi:hypothetical protein